VSLFEREIGDEWTTLHPRVRERYGLEASEGREAIGVGQMAKLGHSTRAEPALWLGTIDDTLFPDGGTDVPFRIITEPFLDANGNEALFLDRRFDTDPPRRFVDTVRWNSDRGCLTDLYGHRGLVAADLHIRAVDGAIALSIGTQWIRLGDRYLELPDAFAIDGHLRDWYDDGRDRFRVAADITTPLVGQVIGYEGRFENEFRSTEQSETTSALGAIDLPGPHA